MMNRNILMLLLSAVLCLMACVAGTESEVSIRKENKLEFMMDGQLWKADQDIFGSYHFSDALGPNLIQIAGNKGRGKVQQSFTMNLYDTQAEGEYRITRSSGSKNVAQLGNLSEQNYLCGGVFQAQNMTVNIIKASKNPQHVEATFSGTLQCVEGNVLQISNGVFYYDEN